MERQVNRNMPNRTQEYNKNKIISGALAGAEGARGRSTIAIEIGNPSSRENLDVTSVRTYVRTHGLGLGTSLSLSLIWSPSLAKSNTKTFFGLSRVNLFVVEIC